MMRLLQVLSYAEAIRDNPFYKFVRNLYCLLILNAWLCRSSWKWTI